MCCEYQNSCMPRGPPDRLVTAADNTFWLSDATAQRISDPGAAPVMHPQRMYARSNPVILGDVRAWDVDPRGSLTALKYLKSRHLINLGTVRRVSTVVPKWASASPAIEAYLRRGDALQSPPVPGAIMTPDQRKNASVELQQEAKLKRYEDIRRLGRSHQRFGEVDTPPPLTHQLTPRDVDDERAMMETPLDASTLRLDDDLDMESTILRGHRSKPPVEPPWVGKRTSRGDDRIFQRIEHDQEAFDDENRWRTGGYREEVPDTTEYGMEDEEERIERLASARVTREEFLHGRRQHVRQQPKYQYADDGYDAPDGLMAQPTPISHPPVHNPPWVRAQDESSRRLSKWPATY